MKHVIPLLVLVSFLILRPSAFSQGSLTPPGPPAATMKTLDQIDAKLEKRTPISSLPYAVNQPGSYYLTQNLATSSGNAITITVDNVSIDLNGFTLTGLSGSSNGIIVSGSHRHIRVYNGSVRGFGSSGVDLSTAVLAELYSLVVSGNGGVGISAGDNVTVRDCVSRENNNDNFRAFSHAAFSHCSAVLSTTGHGFNVASDCQFSNCVSDSNARGYTTTDGGSLSHCVARRNKDYGIYTEKAGIVSNCTSSGQSGVGIRVGDDSKVTECVATLNVGDGIQFTNYCLIAGNNASENGVIGSNASIGIASFGSSNRIDSNIAMHNSNIGINGGASKTDIVTRNSARANAVANYNNNSSNIYFGPIGDASSSSPWVNF